MRAEVFQQRLTVFETGEGVVTSATEVETLLNGHRAGHERSRGQRSARDLRDTTLFGVGSNNSVGVDQVRVLVD